MVALGVQFVDVVLNSIANTRDFLRRSSAINRSSGTKVISKIKWRADGGERTGECHDDGYGSGGSVAHRREGYDGKSGRLLGSNAFRGWRSQCPGGRTHCRGARRGGLDHLVCDAAQLSQGGGYSTRRPTHAWLSVSS